MATRLYFPSSGAAPVTPAGWQFAATLAAPTTYAGARTPSGTAFATETGATGTISPIHRGMVRYVYGPLQAQSISGSVKAQMLCAENNAGANATLAMAIKLIQPNGANRSTLLAQSASDATSTPPEMATALTNRRLLNVSEATPLTLTTQSATAGDYLVVEIGFRSATTTSRTISLRLGDAGGASDLAENDTATTDANPWIEFSGDLAFIEPPPEGSGTAALTLGASGVGKAIQVGFGALALTLGLAGVGDGGGAGSGWTQRFHDTFTDTDGLTLASHAPDVGTAWVRDTTSGSQTWRVTDNAAEPLNVAAYHIDAGVTLGDDQAVEAAVFSNNDDNGIAARYTYTGDGSSLNLTGYALTWLSNSLRLWRVDGAFSGRTELGTDSTTRTPGDVMRLEVVGTTVTAKVNGVTRIGPVTDATYGSGGIGLFCVGGSARFDDFAAYDGGASADTAEGSGNASLTLAATGEGRTTAEGNGSSALVLAATGDGTSTRFGSGTVALSLGASGVGKQAASGAGSAALTLGLAGEGRAVHAGTGSVDLTLGAAGAGAATQQGFGVAALSLQATGIGEAPTGTPTGSGAAALALSASGEGRAVHAGQGTSALTLGALAEGRSTRYGSGAAALTLGATGVGQAPVTEAAEGWGAAALTLGALAEGRSTRYGSGAPALVLALVGAGDNGEDDPTVKQSFLSSRRTRSPLKMRARRIQDQDVQ